MKCVQYEMKNFVKFSNTKDKKGLDKKRASDKDKIRLARKTKQLIRQATIISTSTKEYKQ